MTHERTPMGDLVAALGSLNDPRKDGKVSAGQRQYRYLELPDLLAEVRTKFAAHGWAILQIPDVVDGHVTIVNTWLHESGETMVHPPFSLPCGRTPQEIGSATTYARRYSLAALVGLAGSDDDDARTAQNAPQRPQEPPERLPRPVTRVKAKASDPDPWQTPTPPPPQPKAMGSGITTDQTKMLWRMLNQSGMTEGEIRAFVQAHLNLPGPDWHTNDLTKAQASALITKLVNDQEGTIRLPAPPEDELPLPPEPQK